MKFIVLSFPNYFVDCSTVESLRAAQAVAQSTKRYLKIERPIELKPIDNSCLKNELRKVPQLRFATFGDAFSCFQSPIIYSDIFIIQSDTGVYDRFGDWRGYCESMLEYAKK